MTGADLEVRAASTADWPDIWSIFRAVVATGDTYAYPPDIAEDDARAAWLHVDEGRTVTYVALVDGAVVGTALLKPNLPGLGDHVANAGWMVAPDRAGRGLGRAFASAVIDEARALGFRAMQFNAVVATNARALALWRSLGFEIVGTVPGAFRHVVHGPVDLHVMHRSL
jgi:L-amino acid N-acyltransferase YncA